MNLVHWNEYNPLLDILQNILMTLLTLFLKNVRAGTSNTEQFFLVFYVLLHDFFSTSIWSRAALSLEVFKAFALVPVFYCWYCCCCFRYKLRENSFKCFFLLCLRNFFSRVIFSPALSLNLRVTNLLFISLIKPGTEGQPKQMGRLTPLEQHIYCLHFNKAQRRFPSPSNLVFPYHGCECVCVL